MSFITQLTARKSAALETWSLCPIILPIYFRNINNWGLKGMLSLLCFKRTKSGYLFHFLESPLHHRSNHLPLKKPILIFPFHLIALMQQFRLLPHICNLDVNPRCSLKMWRQPFLLLKLYKGTSNERLALNHLSNQLMTV